ncbi:hypothetical protein RSOL_124150 [Rhizoctonia solani AG-3 Rhs1AP]|uniref:Fungal-type protein kinase domain-containing protein n=2 Tax=Rhizoctonia solani AG-3 TaxID=1086053 RepID=A0A074SCU7_9AGAM|nr:hypothetical protein RSOL_124150 [Rhizoctonia solani AG-3 Rhs1AP]KEP47852.1 hypothetical protein V565_141700 [Rhizoctonia solani 123E]
MIKSSVHVSGLISSSLSTSSQAINEGYSCYNKAILAPAFNADVGQSETCGGDQLLAVILDRCCATEPPNDPSTPRILQSANASQHSSPESTVTERPSRNSNAATNDPNSSAPDSESPVDVLPVTRELFDSCLQKVIPICNTPEMRRLIQKYKQCPKETTRYEPFVELANYALECVKSLELPELRDVSTSNILFHVNYKKGIKGIDDVYRFPDIVLVPLASAQRIHDNPTGNWKECAEHVDTTRDGFNWPDVLIAGEMKWHKSTLECPQPETYDTGSKGSIRPIPTRADAPGFASILPRPPASGSVAPSGVSIPPSSTRSGSTQGSTPSVIKAHGFETPSGSGLGCKRPGDDIEQRSSKKSTADKIGTDNLNEPSPQSKVNHKTKEGMLDAMLQLSINAAEMLRCSLGRRHAFGMIIIDTVVWIWWFDRQGPIQSEGIDFNENLPRFLVFLLAIQRFDLADWGFDKELDPSIPLRHASSSQPTPQPVEYEVNKKGGKLKVHFTFDIKKQMHEVFNLKGKSTNVFPVAAPGEPTLVAKLYWPNRNRPHEVKIIEHARKNEKLLNHLPDARGWRDIDPIGTQRIRDQLGISSNSPRHPRRLVIIVFEKLFPITTLRGEFLVFAWLQCIRTHYLLWEKGIRHLDLSLGNLMIRKMDSDDEPKYYGVVNDWDLGDNEKNLVESRKDLTKTILFTSLDLLQPSSPGAQVVQRYSHELESFIWILIWVFLAVEKGETNPTQEVHKWQTSDPGASHTDRSLFLRKPYNYIPHNEWWCQWPMARDVAKWLDDFIEAKDMARANARAQAVQAKLVDANQVLSKNEVSNQKDSNLDETPEERKELLRGLLKTVNKHIAELTPPSLEIDDL